MDSGFLQTQNITIETDVQLQNMSLFVNGSLHIFDGNLDIVLGGNSQIQVSSCVVIRNSSLSVSFKDIQNQDNLMILNSTCISGKVNLGDIDLQSL